eukprot:gnl/MRDRNA2_/MRDRNA2_72413_c0_seq1.p1 gnl/MRDRNA2_/MRDRNA2_72413_c0~~gnl/MRDRNA2_/MRDRNA2_72413_c0_seq1.p1  ORF type:complete len:414 (-),score=51.51 gnl/MRDRNA2_/MRDRNA2_72413_c0_seq1:511-1752(-)
MMSCLFWAFGASCLDQLVDGLPLMGSPEEFPPRYHNSVRGLSRAIKDARPADTEALTLPVILQDKRRWLLKVNVSSAGIDIAGLKNEVARIERHFRRIRGMSGSPDLQMFVPIQGITRPDLFRLTAYASYYNIFFLDSPAVGSLYWTIKQAFHQYARTYRLDLSRTYFLHGWFNCFRGGGHIRFHRHSFGLAGNLAIHVPPGSFTQYGSLGSSSEYRWLHSMQQQCQAGQRKSCEELADRWRYADPLAGASELDVKPVAMPNTAGELVMFHGLVEHGSSNVTEEMRRHLEQSGPEDCRMTIAFDIDTDPADLHHTVPLYDPKDPWWTLDWPQALGDAIGEKMEQIYQDLNSPVVFDWDLMPSSKAFAERMRRARLHQSSATLSSWSKQQVRTGWADFRDRHCSSAGGDNTMTT